MPKLLKLGKTKNDPNKRAEDLYTTGVPGPFEVKFAIYSKDYENMEKIIHGMLSDCRYNKSREFFTITPEEAKSCIENRFPNLHWVDSYEITYNTVSKSLYEFIEYMKKNKYFDDYYDDKHERKCKRLRERLQYIEDGLQNMQDSFDADYHKRDKIQISDMLLTLAADINEFKDTIDQMNYPLIE